MAQEVLSPGAAYGIYLLEKWKELSELGEIIREKRLSDRVHNLDQSKYISKLCSFWMEVKPFIYSKDTKTAQKFKEFEDICITKKIQLANFGNYKIWIELEMNLRQVIDDLKLTRFEEAGRQ